MLTLIEGGFSSGLFERIKRCIMQSRERGRRIYLIVPEQQTVIAEAQMTDFMPKDAPLYFEVTNFTRLANTAFRALGGVANEYCDGAKRTLIMWRALSEVSPLLSSTGGFAEIPASLAEKYVSAIAEIQSMGLDAQALEELAQSDAIRKDARLKNKLTDLSLAMTVFKRLMSEKYSDTADDLGTMLTLLKENGDFLCDSDVYVDGFTSFTEEQYRILDLIGSRTSLTVSLMIPKARRDAFEFSELARTHDTLTARAARSDVRVSLVRIDGNFGKSDPLLYELVNDLWRFNAKIDNEYLQNTESVRVFAAKTPFEMCDFLCADIRRRVAGGARYSDLAVISGSQDAYSGILDSALKKYGIPYFASYKRDADEFSAIKLIFAAYRAVSTGFAREDVISYLKCGFSGVSDADADLFEAYVNRWRIDKGRFTDGLFWGMNPEGFESRVSQRSADLLTRVDATKKALIEPLLALKERASDCTTVRDHATALVDFLISIDLEGQLSKKALELLADKEGSEAEEYSRLWGTVCKALDGLVDAVGDMTATAESFLIQLKIIFSGVEIGRIPAYADEVTVGNADMLRLYGKKHVYLIGVNEGEFPRSVADSAFFGERDRQLMSLAGVDFASSIEIKNARELFCFSRAASYAEEGITLLYYENTAAMKGKKRSDAIDRIIAISNGSVKPIRICELPAIERVWTPDSATDTLGELSAADYAQLKAALCEVGEDATVRIAESSVTNEDMSLSRSVTDMIYGDSLSLSQSKIESFVDCPLKYFCKYNLNLTEEEVYEFGASSIGTFVHSILESFFKELKTRGQRVADLTAEERDNMTARAAKEYLESLGEGFAEGGEQMKIRVSRLVRAARPVVEGLCDEFSNCDFIPSFFELRISERDNDLPDTPIFKTEDGRTVRIHGSADRTDTFRSGGDLYVRVVDYKTGDKTFTPEDIKNKRNLQMFLYLKAISESKSQGFMDRLGAKGGDRILPAGVIYVSTAVGDLKVDSYDEQSAIDAAKKTQRRQGMLLDDPVSIGAMNKSFIPIKYNKDGLSESSKRLLYTEEGWSDIMKDVEDAVVEVSSRICTGMVAPLKDSSRKTNPCEFCSYKPICRRIKYN